MTEEQFKISLKVTGWFPNMFNWRKVSKLANFKLRISVFSLAWGALAQSRVNFWQNRDFPIPAFPMTRIELGFSWSSLIPINILSQCSTGVPMTFSSYSSSSLHAFVMSFLTRTFLPCCTRGLMNISSVFAFEIAREGSSICWSSVWPRIDDFRAAVWALTAERKEENYLQIIWTRGQAAYVSV